jgi:hypothetical protein
MLCELRDFRYNAITTKPSPRSSEANEKNRRNNTPNAKLTASTFLSSNMYRSLLECYGASSIIAKVEVCLETAPDEEDLHVMSVVRRWQRVGLEGKGNIQRIRLRRRIQLLPLPFRLGGHRLSPSLSGDLLERGRR